MKKENLYVRAADIFDIPADPVGGLLHVEMTGGREVFVENHKGILELSENEAVLSADGKTLRITGDKIAVLAMNTSEVRFSGNIYGITLE